MGTFRGAKWKGNDMTERGKSAVQRSFLALDDVDREPAASSLLVLDLQASGGAFEGSA